MITLLNRVNSFLYFLKINGPIDKSKICFELDIPLTYLTNRLYVKEHENLCYITQLGRDYLKTLDDPSIKFDMIPEEMLGNQYEWDEI